jgi:glutamate transport system permease protein
MFVGALYIVINYFVGLSANKVEQLTRRRGRSAGGPIAPDQIDQAAVAVAAAAANPGQGGHGG